MEFHGVPPQLKKFSSGDGDINCTLRLGLPYYDEPSEENQKQTLPILNMVGSYIKVPKDMGKGENGETLSYLASLQLQAWSPAPQTLSHNMYAYVEVPASAQRTIGKKAVSYRCCNICGLTKTPMWRKGPLGPQTLCNACGLRYARAIKRPAKSTCNINSASASASANAWEERGPKALQDFLF